MQKQLIIASANKHKSAEIAHQLAGSEWQVTDLNALQHHLQVEEHGHTFEQNATIKALAWSKLYPQSWVLADDSGLCVDALDGQPGVYSSSFGGEEGNHARNNQKLVSELGKRQLQSSPARFECIMVLARAGEVVAQSRGVVTGSVRVQPSGSQGFGYDPHFFADGYEQSFAELGMQQKNQLSHRGRALAAMLQELAKLA